MVNKLHFKDEKKNKIWIVLILALIIIGFLVYIFNKISFSSFGTGPEEILNYTKGQFTIQPHEYISFQEFYEQVKPSEEKSSFLIQYSELRTNFTLVMPRLETKYRIYEYEPEYYDYCEGKRVEINFSQSKYSEFKFNYSDKEFTYRINLYRDLYSFSDNLKNQDCYFETDKYTEGFLEDPYNNYFIDAISRNFISLKEQGYSNDEIAEIATVFVQSIPYGTDSTDMNRYPYETIYENQGNCLDKSLILVGILKNLGYTTYIFSGESEDESHALVGIVCDKGNVEYNNQDVCFIETTIYTPISSDIEIDIEESVKTSNGTLIYYGINYGRALINSFDIEYTKAGILESKLDSINSDLMGIEWDMCETDCVVCGDGMFGVQFVDWEESESIHSCYDAKKFNSLIEDYNNKIKQYNLLVEEWYVPYYDLEKFMFGNVEFIERQ